MNANVVQSVKAAQRDAALRKSGGKALDSIEDLRVVVKHCPFLQLYRTQPSEMISLFDLEALVMKRMELLAYVDGLRNSPAVHGPAELIAKVRVALHDENFVSEAHRQFEGDDVRGKPLVDLEAGQTLSNASDSATIFSFTASDDAIAHLACRMVFCQSEQWRDWFVKNEETILRARLEKMSIPANRAAIFEAAQLPCRPVDVSTLDESVIMWLQYKLGIQNSGKMPELFFVPISHAARAMRHRNCVCVNGFAIVTSENLFDSYMTIFRTTLHQGLQEAAVARQHALLATDDDALCDAMSNVLMMLDAFFARFIVDPSDAVKPAKEGAITAAQIPALAQCHFPPCMRRTEEHLRREHHLKHTGRWSYGLFLKALGLSLEDSMRLFASLLTLKAAKDFEKSAYAYNLRHMYGKEGKRTSYSALTCATIINQPPNLDKHDCHGCPFRFKDESVLRGMLSTPRPAVQGGGALIKIAPHDIEDIVQDSREMHYTRACFKYFTVTHAGAKLQRDSLFRTPSEYYSASVQLWQAVADKNTPGGTAQSPSGTAGVVKRERGDEVTPPRPTMVGPMSERAQAQP